MLTELCSYPRNVSLTLNGDTLAGLYGKTLCCCLSDQIFVRTHCCVFTSHLTGVLHKTSKISKTLDPTALLNVLFVPRTLLTAGLERYLSSQWIQYLDTTATDLSKSHVTSWVSHSPVLLLGSCSSFTLTVMEIIFQLPPKLGNKHIAISHSFFLSCQYWLLTTSLLPPLHIQQPYPFSLNKQDKLEAGCSQSHWWTHCSWLRGPFMNITEGKHSDHAAQWWS